MKTVLLALLEQYADWEAAYVSTGIHKLGYYNTSSHNRFVKMMEE